MKKRYVLHLAAFNLSLVMRLLVGCGTPRGFSDAVEAARAALAALSAHVLLVIRSAAMMLHRPLSRATLLLPHSTHIATAA